MKIKTGLTITNDDKASRLHEEFFNDASTTDTMSFPFNEATPEGDYFLGDIVVNYDEVKRTAKDLSLPEKEELARLIVHSALHLMGMDDATEDSAEEMRQSENRVLGKVLGEFEERQ